MKWRDPWRCTWHSSPLFPMGPISLFYFLQPKPIITLSTNKSIHTNKVNHFQVYNYNIHNISTSKLCYGKLYFMVKVLTKIFNFQKCTSQKIALSTKKVMFWIHKYWQLIVKDKKFEDKFVLVGWRSQFPIN